MLDLAKHNQKSRTVRAHKIEDHYEAALVVINHKRAGKPITPKERPRASIDGRAAAERRSGRRSFGGRKVPHRPKARSVAWAAVLAQ
jgi:DNA end-binding protein Ku